jgi:transcriptional regulator with XRE-family HTH domain
MLIQKLRLQRGWSQEQLAQMSGLSVRTIQRIERGQGASPESLKSLAAVFEIDFSQLHTESGMQTDINQGVSPDEALAFKQVRKIKGFYTHLMQYVIVVGALAVFNLVVSPARPWVIFVALGWGLGLLIHGLRAFDRMPFLGPEWEKAQVEKRLGRKF